MVADLMSECEAKMHRAIESLQKERDVLIAKRDGLRRELDEYLNGLTVG